MSAAEKKKLEDQKKKEEAEKKEAEKKALEANKGDREAAKKAKEAARKNLKKWKKVRLYLSSSRAILTIRPSLPSLLRPTTSRPRVLRPLHPLSRSSLPSSMSLSRLLSLRRSRTSRRRSKRPVLELVQRLSSSTRSRLWVTREMASLPSLPRY